MITSNIPTHTKCLVRANSYFTRHSSSCSNQKRGNLDMRYTFFFMIRISELEVLPNHLNQLISDMQAPVRVDIYAVLLHIWINLIVKFRTNDTNTIFRTHCTHFCTWLFVSCSFTPLHVFFLILGCILVETPFALKSYQQSFMEVTGRGLFLQSSFKTIMFFLIESKGKTL